MFFLWSTCEEIQPHIDTLQNLGFEVTKKTDADLKTMQSAASDFILKIADYDVALFFYVGHGLQVDGVNYLIPTDAELYDWTMAKNEAFYINGINDAFALPNISILKSLVKLKSPLLSSQS